MEIEDRLLRDWFLTLELSSGCNLTCPGCPQSAAGKKLVCMERDLLIDILNGISKDQVKFSSLTPFFRGEPFYNSQFTNDTRLLYEFNRKLDFYGFLTIHTNGLYSDADNLDEIFKIMSEDEYGELIMSVDANDLKTYQKIRPGSRFETVVLNAKEMIKMYKNSFQNFSVAIQFVEGTENSSGYHEFYRFWDDFACSVGLTLTAVHEKECILKDNPGLYLIRKPSAELLQHVQRHDSDNSGNNDQFGCHKPWISPVIGVQGELTYCCSDYDFNMLNKNKKYNIRDFDYSIKAFWNSDIMAEVRKDFTAGIFPDRCIECRKMGLSLEVDYR